MKSLQTYLLIAVTLLVAGCAGGPVQRATKFTSYEDFRAGPDGGVDLVWARIGLGKPERLIAKISEYDSVVIDQVFVVAEEDSIDQEDIQELTDYTIARLTEKISVHKKVVGSLPATLCVLASH